MADEKSEQRTEIDALVESLYRLAEGYATYVATATGPEVARDLRALAGTYREDDRHATSATTSSTVRELRRATRVIESTECPTCHRPRGQACRNLHVINDPRDRVFPHKERIAAYMVLRPGQASAGDTDG